MDPNAALRRWRRAIMERDSEEAQEALQDLKDWIRRGGFPPTLKMMPHERAAIGLGKSGRRNPPKAAKLNVGDTVKLTSKFLKSTGSTQGARKWTVLGFDGSFAIVDEPIYDPSAFTPDELARDPSLKWRRIHVGNLMSTGKRNPMNPIRHFPKTKRGRPPSNRQWVLTAYDAKGVQLKKDIRTATQREAYKMASALVGKRFGKSAVAKVLLDGPK